MNKGEFDILGGTFSNLNIINKQSNIASIVEEMDKEENHSIKLITSSPRDEYIKMRYMKRRMKNLGKSITLTNNKSPKKHSLPLLQKKNKSKKKIHNLLLGNNNQKPFDLVSPRNKKSYFLNNEKLRLNECFPEKKDVNDKKEHIETKKLYNTLNINNKKPNLFNIQKQHQMKTIDSDIINNIIQNKQNKHEIPIKNEKCNSKYYQTANQFSEQKLFSNRNNINKKKIFLTKTKSVKAVKSIPRLKISEEHLSDIEKKLNTVYELSKNDFLEKDKEIKVFKKKYQSLFDQNERFFSYDIASIAKEINEQFLSLKFKDFYSYLLTILQNYDKHIVDWKFGIEKEKKECPSELKLKNVKIKHKRFMEKLIKQYDCGLKVNKFMDDIIKNSKKKAMIFKEIKNRNKIHEIINKKMNQDDLVDKIFENNQIYQSENNLNNLNNHKENNE